MPPVPRFPFFATSSRSCLAGAIACACVAAGHAQLGVGASSTLFGTNGLSTYVFDPAGDQQANHYSLDIVGGGALAAFQTASANDTLYFRLRLNVPQTYGSQGPGTFSQVVAVGIDLDGASGFDLAFAATGKNGPGLSAGQTYFMAFGAGDASSPNSTNWGSPYAAQNWVTSGAAADFNYDLVSRIDGAVGDVAGSSGPNTFVTFAVSYARLQDAVRALGEQYAGFVVDSTSVGSFRFSGYTGTQTNVVNIDTIADGHVIPEMSTLAFLLVGALPLALWQWRQMRRGRDGPGA